MLFMDGKERTKSFDVDWDDAAAKTWFEDLLSSAQLFYYNNFIPAIRKYHQLPTAITTPGRAGSRQSIGPLSPSRVTPVSSPAPAIPPTAPEAGPSVDQTPSFAVGKRVYDTKQGKGGVIVGLDDNRMEAVIEWDGEEKGRKRPRKLENLVVQLVDNPKLPQYKGQIVLLNKCGKNTAHLIGKRGKVLTINTNWCRVKFEDGTKTKIMKEHLHCISHDAEEPTIPMNATYNVSAENFFEALADYQKKHKIRLLESPSQESFQRSVEELKRRNNLK